MDGIELMKKVHAGQLRELEHQQKRQLEFIAGRPANVKPDSYWIVIYECRYAVVHVSPMGDGFFAPGQEPCWHFNNVVKWIKEIEMPKDNNV